MFYQAIIAIDNFVIESKEAESGEAVVDGDLKEEMVIK